MLRGFTNFLLKELKELVRDPKILIGMIIVPVILFPILGGIMSFSVQSAQETAQKTVVLVINRDSGENSSQFISFLNSTLKIVPINASSIDEAIPLLPENNAKELIEIPAGFSQNVMIRSPTLVKFYSVFSGAGLLEGIGSSIVDSLVEQFNRQVAPDLIVSQQSVIVNGKVANIDPRTFSSLMLSQQIALPITLIILLTYSMQIAATSVAMEKEEKTLETLLTLPMDRFAILMGKLSGSAIIAGVGAVAYMIGFTYYLGSLTGIAGTGGGADLVSLGLVPSLSGYVILGISLFITLLSALALALILSAFAEDVRGAQSLVSYVFPFLFVPSLILLYIDINTLPVWLRTILFAIPYSQPIIASRAVAMGDYLTAILGIVYVTAFTAVIMYVASRLFATEKILTAKLKFRGLRRRTSQTVE